MAAPPLSNNFEGGTNGTTITAANSGGASGNAFDAVTNSTGTLTYSSTQARGALSCKMVTAATFAEIRVDWTGLGSILTSVWTRQYLYLAANPSVALDIVLARTNAGAASGGLQISTTGKVLSIGNTPGTVSIATNQWIRVEGRFLCSTTVGEEEWRLFNNADATVADDTVNTTGLVLGANCDQFRFGMPSAGPGSTTVYMDEIAVSTTGWLGPSAASPPLPPVHLPFMR